METGCALSSCATQSGSLLRRRFAFADIRCLQPPRSDAEAPKSSRKRARTRCGPCFNCVPWRAKKKCPQQPGGGPTGKGSSGVFLLPYLGVHVAEAQAVTTGLARRRLSAASMEFRRRAQDVKVQWQFHSLTVLLLCNTNDCRCRVMSLTASSYLPVSACQAPPRPQETRCGQTASQRHDRRGASNYVTAVFSPGFYWQTC